MSSLIIESMHPIRRRALLRFGFTGLVIGSVGCVGVNIGQQDESQSTQATSQNRSTEETMTISDEDSDRMRFPEQLRIQNRTGEPLEVNVTVSNDSGVIDSQTIELPAGPHFGEKIEFSLEDGEAYEFTVNVDGGASATRGNVNAEWTYLAVEIESRDEISILVVET